MLQEAVREGRFHPQRDLPLWSAIVVIKIAWMGLFWLEMDCASLQKLYFQNYRKLSVMNPKKIDKISLMSRYGTVTGPLRDRYGTVTGVPLMFRISLLKPPRKTISVKIYRYGTVTGPLRDRYGGITGTFQRFPFQNWLVCEHHLGLIAKL